MSDRENASAEQTQSGWDADGVRHFKSGNVTDRENESADQPQSGWDAVDVRYFKAHWYLVEYKWQISVFDESDE